MDYFTDILSTFLDIECGSCISVYAGCRKALEFHQKYLYLCSGDEQRPYGFHSTDIAILQKTMCTNKSLMQHDQI